MSIDKWYSAVSGSFSTTMDWSAGAPNGDSVGIGGADTTGNASFAVAQTGSDDVLSLDVLGSGGPAATLNVSGTLTVDDTAGAGTPDVTEATVTGTLNIQSHGVLAIGGASDSGAAGAAASAFQGEILDGGGKITVATNGKLLVNEPVLTLTGGGATASLQLAGGSLVGSAANADVLSNLDNTISGYGTIGNSSGADGLEFVNGVNGVVNANGAAALVLTSGSLADQNDGLIEATGSGGLLIDSALDNEGELATAKGSQIVIDDALVSGRGQTSIAAGSTLQLEKGGAISQSGEIAIGAGATLKDTTGDTGGVGASVTAANAGDDSLSTADLENAGAISVVANSTLNLNASVYNTGAGDIAVSGTLSTYNNGAAVYGGKLALNGGSIVDNTSGQQFSFFDGATVVGSGTIGNGYLRLYVDGDSTIDATGALTINDDALAVAKNLQSADYSAGVIETTGAGSLTVKGNFGNAGVIEAAGTGVVTLENGLINGLGLLKTTKSGQTIQLDNENVQIAATYIAQGSALTTTGGDSDSISGVFNSGAIDLAQGSTLAAYNDIDGAGSIVMKQSAMLQVGVVAGNNSNLMLSGGGVIDMNYADDVLTGDASGVGASNGSGGTVGGDWFGIFGSTIQGEGVIGSATGATNLNLQNNGTIDANGAQALTIDTGDQSFGNNKLLETTGAGGLKLNGVIYNQGQIVAAGAGVLKLASTQFVSGYDPGSTPEYEGAVITGNGDVDVNAGGTLSLSNGSVNCGGAMAIAAGGKILVAAGTTDEIASGNVTENAGAIDVGAGATLFYNGQVNNAATGTMAIGTSSGAATLEIESWGWSNVGGAIALNDGSTIESDGQNENFWNSGDISGWGGIGDAHLYVANGQGGVIDATGGSGDALTLTLDNPANGLSEDYNSGTMETTAAGGLVIDGGTASAPTAFDNAGLLLAKAGKLILNAVNINSGGGLVEATGGGTIVLENNSVISHAGYVSIGAGSTLSTTGGDSDDILNANLIDSGTLYISANSTLSGQGHWLDSGGLISLGGTLDVIANDILRLQGTGVLDMSARGSLIQGGKSSSFRNVDSTIEGEGEITGSGLSFVNANGATVKADDALALTFDAVGSVQNAGLMESTGQGGLVFDVGVLNTGTIAANTGAVVLDGAVTGSGLLTIGASGAMTLGGADSNEVQFSGHGGALTMFSESDAQPEILGFDAGSATPSDSIIIGGSGFSTQSPLSLTYSPDGGGTLGGELTISTQGSDLAVTLHFLGAYSASSFKASVNATTGQLVVT